MFTRKSGKCSITLQAVNGIRNLPQPLPFGSLTDRSVARILKSRVRALLLLRGKTEAGADELVERFSGHSMRAGYVTWGAAMDIRAYRLQQHARHKSAAMVAVYVREAEKWTKSGLKGIGF